MIPDETTIYCSRCSVFNIGDDCCICKSCLNKIIDEVLNYRRRKANQEIEDERSMAHTHTTINLIEKELKEKLNCEPKEVQER